METSCHTLGKPELQLKTCIYAQSRRNVLLVMVATNRSGGKKKKTNSWENSTNRSKKKQEFITNKGLGMGEEGWSGGG